MNLSQAKLLELDAEDNVNATMAALDAVLGLDRLVTYDLVEDTTPLATPPADADQLVETAFQQRPDLEALNYSQQAAVKYSHAQRDQLLPTISAAGTAGSVPVRPDQYYVSNWWGGIGVNMEVPIFNGFLFTAQAKEASIRAEAAAEQSRDLRDRIARDVRTAWLEANTGYQKVAVTAELLQEANLALKLAQTRYQLGLSSIVELQPGAIPANRRGDREYRCTISVSARPRGARISNRSDTMIENFKLKVFRVVADTLNYRKPQRSFI